jgi:hypothetical protein
MTTTNIGEDATNGARAQDDNPSVTVPLLHYQDLVRKAGELRTLTAAKGAIGEREAFCKWVISKDAAWWANVYPEQAAEFAWQARAALTAEKVAGQEEPAWRELCRRLYVELFHCDQQMRSTHDEDGEPHWTQSTIVRDVLADAKTALEAAPQQPAQSAEPCKCKQLDDWKGFHHPLCDKAPAQSAEQDEPAAYLVRGLDCHNEEYATVWIKRGNAEAAAAAIYRASITPLVVPSAAATQSTAPQPAQTQVALTDEQVMSVSIINGEVTDYKYAGNLLDGEYPLYVVRHLTEGQAASILAAALRFETEGNKPMANDLRNLLAAQPVSGGKS